MTAEPPDLQRYLRRYRYGVGIAPEWRVGEAAVLVTTGSGDPALAIPCDAGSVDAVLDAERDAIAQAIAERRAIILLCSTRGDQLLARDRFVDRLPAGWAVRT